MQEQQHYIISGFVDYGVEFRVSGSLLSLGFGFGQTVWGFGVGVLELLKPSLSISVTPSSKPQACCLDQEQPGHPSGLKPASALM